VLNSFKVIGSAQVKVRRAKAKAEIYLGPGEGLEAGEENVRPISVIDHVLIIITRKASGFFRRQRYTTVPTVNPSITIKTTNSGQKSGPAEPLPVKAETMRRRIGMKSPPMIQPQTRSRIRISRLGCDGQTNIDKKKLTTMVINAIKGVFGDMAQSGLIVH
jgi:hypothetical protein